MELEWEKKEAASGETSEWVEESADSTRKDHTGDSESGSSKRRRAQDTWCSVDGCDSDMRGCREYHRRHRVCEKHSKTAVVLIGGKQQRFCQQCSRFHSLGEFDEVKRSCRKRLDGHNRRRRKPQPPSLFMSADKLLSTYNGPRILHFGNPQTYANQCMRSMWPATAKAGAESLSVSYDQHSVLSSSANVQHQQEKQLPLLQANGNETFSGISMTQPISAAIAPSASGRGSWKVSSDCKSGSYDPDCALYLLSTLQTQSPELSLVQSTITSPMQSPLGDVHLDAGDKYSCSESSQETNLYYDGMLHIWSDGMAENRDSPTTPFFWE